MSDPIHVFISYSHDSAAHRARVRQLVDRLRGEGVTVIFDRMFEDVPPAKGWPLWMLDEVDAAKYVLVVATETYNRRFRGHEAEGKGLGVTWEGAIISTELYEAQGKNLKFIPVLFDAEDSTHIPLPLRPTTHYNVSTDKGYDDLYYRLTGQRGYVAPDVGTIRTRTPSSDPT